MTYERQRHTLTHLLDDNSLPKSEILLQTYARSQQDTKSWLDVLRRGWGGGGVRVNFKHNQDFFK